MAKKLNDGYELHPVDMKDKLLKEPRTIKGSAKDKTSPNVKGCPGNDNNEHVYRHVLIIMSYPDRPGKADGEIHYWGPCIGCGHNKKTLRRGRPTGEPDVVEHRSYRNFSSWF